MLVGEEVSLPSDGDDDNSNVNFGRPDCNRNPDEGRPSKCKKNNE